MYFTQHDEHKLLNILAIVARVKPAEKAAGVGFIALPGSASL
jgi:hypothetical protein